MLELKLLPTDGNLINLNMTSPQTPGVVLTLAPFFKGERGLPGGSSIEIPAAEAVGGHRMVIRVGDTASYATNENLEHGMKVLGMTENSAAAGATLSVVRSGKISEPSWNWDIAKPVFLGVSGLLTQTPPQPPAAFSLIIGFPISATEIFVSLREPLALGV